MLKLFMGKVQRRLLLSLSKKKENEIKFDETLEMPGNVKEGHFAVFVVKGQEPETSIVQLCCLSRPGVSAVQAGRLTFQVVHSLDAILFGRTPNMNDHVGKLWRWTS
ncbi:hypothetical protein NL676_003174 [Syzygium grande]|nr:hypothetical protein NL676_003174 [Syzygium grande]